MTASAGEAFSRGPHGAVPMVEVGSLSIGKGHLLIQVAPSGGSCIRYRLERWRN